MGALHSAAGAGVAYLAAGGLAVLDSSGPEPRVAALRRVGGEAYAIAALGGRAFVPEPYTAILGNTLVYSNRLLTLDADADGRLVEDSAVELPWWGSPRDIAAVPGGLMGIVSDGTAVFSVAPGGAPAVTDLLKTYGLLVADPARGIVYQAATTIRCDDQDPIGTTTVCAYAIDPDGRARQVGIGSSDAGNEGLGGSICGGTDKAIAASRDRLYVLHSIDETGVGVMGAGWVVRAHDLVVFDVSEPAPPRPIGRERRMLLDDPREPLGNVFAAAATVLYSVYWRYGHSATLRVLDMSDASHPSEIGRLVAPDPAAWTFPAAIARSGWRLYLATDDHIHEIDVSDPASPRHVTSVTVVGKVAVLAADDGALWVATGRGGVVRLPIPFAP